jgi:hypothetical protein
VVRVHLQRRGNRLARIVAAPLVEREFGEQHARRQVVGIDGQRLLERRLGRRRIRLERGPREADHRRHVAGVRLQRELKGFLGFGGLRRLEEQLAPAGVDDGVVRAQAVGFAEVVVGVTVFAERA